MKEFLKEFFIRNYKNIILTLLGVLLVYLLIRTFTPTPDNSELIKYKLEKLDEEINSIMEQRKKIDESINLYNEKIRKIDSTISKIKVEKSVVNNYYEIKENKLSKSTAKQIDSLLRVRYKY
jgi:septal ring factor EnvC (AmiA/AmiB activator)